MIITVEKGPRHGTVTAPSSKSAAHRMLICAALSDAESRLVCRGISKDILATVSCLTALGASIDATNDGFISVRPIKAEASGPAELLCGESGSTLRFLLPVAGALGRNAVFHMAGRLPERPVEPLIDVLCGHGLEISRSGALISTSGRLKGGVFRIAADVSSQFISGLLMALARLDEGGSVELVGPEVSQGYTAMTVAALAEAGISVKRFDGGYSVPGGQRYRLRGPVSVEADWSAAAFFLCMGALSDRGVTVTDLSLSSVQGDRAILDILRGFGADVRAERNAVTVCRGRLCAQTVDASQIPDLVPVISAVAAVCEGTTRITNAGRLRLKESDRLQSTAGMLSALGADVVQRDDGLVIKGRPMLYGGRAPSFGDHRIAMSAAVAAGACINNVIVEDAQCAEKSYPGFWEDAERLEVKK